MKKTCFILLWIELLFGGYTFAAPQTIKLSVRKGHVLASNTRVDVLAAAETYLNQGSDDFILLIEDIGNPYTFEVEEAPVPVEEVSVPSVVVGREKVRRPVAVAPVVYSDASVLKVIASSFSKKVRGTLAKGGVYYLQLQGGGLLKAGTRFPVKIPQIKGQSFTVTVSTVNSRGYTLQMGDASLAMSLNALSAQSAGAIKRSKP